ncbi:TIGR03085 family metal-binding protein [Umezawaea beigongshangensis]|uniref:TIGR03085 family metal-binding protein n=1 Tax=Umezawaea beigongshangensis TaxID=2780383 RepID=UPI0018F12C05|nr:TIGR03085 family metal-binding protein [Umezawaea beigongshangensis]
MGLADDERRLLSDLLTEVGPEAPTLCSGWRAKDLAAHLVLRERRPDAVLGIVAPALAARTQRVQDSYAAKPWPELVNLVRGGPPRWTPFALPKVGELLNAGEYFIHHEDVRRAVEGWEPRPADERRDAPLWATLKQTSRMRFRTSAHGVLLRRPDGRVLVAKDAPSPVTITGPVGELVLFCSGRDAVRVEFEGDPEAVAAVRSLDRTT